MAISWQTTVAGQQPWVSQLSQVTSRSGTAGASGSVSSTSASSAYSVGNAASATGFSSATAHYSYSDTGITDIGDGNTASAYGATNNGGGIGTTTYSYSSTLANTVTFTRTSAPTTSSGSNRSSGSQSHEVTRNVVGNNWSQTIRDTTCNFGITTTSSATASGVATAAYTSGTATSAVVGYRSQTTTQTTTRSVITKHSDSSLSSTTTESQTYTETIQAYGTTNTTQISYVTASYVLFTNHTQSVWEAAYSDFLRQVTATPTAITGLDALLGAPVRTLTISTMGGSYSYGAAISQAFSTFTLSNVFGSNVPTTLTTTLQSYVPVTVGAADGWIGATNTELRYAPGIYTGSYEASLRLTTSAATFTTEGRATYTKLSFVGISYIFTDTVTGLDAAGSSSSYVIQKVSSTLSKYTSTIVANDAGVSSSSIYGSSVTKFISPAISYNFGRASAKLSRLEKGLGYQAASSLGSNGGRGASLIAASSFYIGTENFVMGNHNRVLTPVNLVSTASTADSSYTFVLGSNSVWSVTALKTDTSSSTLTAFTASISTTGAAELFMNQNSSWYSTTGKSVVGGFNALSGINQMVTFEGLAGWKYTLRDATSTTAYTTHLANYTTANIGTSLLAVDSFSAAFDVSSQAESPMLIFILPFNQ